MLRAASSAVVAAVAAFVTFNVVSAGSLLDNAATARRPAARVATPVGEDAPVTTAPDPEPTGEGAQVVALLNAVRRDQGLSPLDHHARVSAAAAAHSADQAAHDTMRHRGSDGSHAGDRLERAGFTWGSWGENVGSGYGTADAMFQGWMNSSGHRQNMLGDFDYVGVAVVDAADGTRYWTMVLAS